MIRFPVAALLIGAASAHAATFDGYQCTDDCSGHRAGYDWAEENNISDDSACSTASQSFNEGCESYVNGGAGVITGDDNSQQTWSDDDDDDDDE